MVCTVYYWEGEKEKGNGPFQDYGNGGEEEVSNADTFELYIENI